MLAYVFWHWPRADTVASVYEERLVHFQKALAAARPTGFREAVAFRVAGAPWLPAGVVGYEDWYVLDGSAALDPLNEAAVAAACRVPHDEAAKLATGGMAGLYRLRRGEAVLAAGFAHWFGKPAGVRYEDLYAQLRALTEQPGVALWGRQMTLGPTPEFCLQSPRTVELPGGLAARTLERTRVCPA
jgi:hypothetical protein